MEAHIKKATEIFTRMDKDKNGALNAAEIKNLCKELDWDSTTCPAAIVAFDFNGDGRITLDEFIEYYKFKLMNNKEEMFRKLFNKIDKDRNGVIDVKEMIYFSSLVGEPITEEEAAAQLKAIDEDKDGKVNFKELYYIFQDCEF